MKASELIKLIQEKIEKHGDKEIMISQFIDDNGGEVWTTNISVTTLNNSTAGHNLIVIEEVV